MYDFSEMNAEQLEARLAELKDETSEEKRGALDNDALAARVDEIAEILTELENRRQAAAEEERKAEEVTRMQGEPIIDTEVKKMFDISSKEYRDLWLRNLQGNLTPEERSGETYTSGNSNAVPTIVADKFFEKMKKLAPMLSEITLMQVAGNLKFVAEGTR